jgi:hypothetical protein
MKMSQLKRESGKGFADNLKSEINDCYKYATAIDAKGEPFPIEPLIMSLCCCYLSIR